MPSPIYVPANSGDNCVDWWREDAIWKYNYILFSAGLAIKDKLRRDYEITDRVTIIGDSGGFQQCSQGVILSAIDVMKWLEENANIGFILDRPPYETIGNSGIGMSQGDETFKARLDLTIKNTETMLSVQENSDFNLYGVLQGDTFERMNIWYDKMKQYDFKGWGLAIKSGKPRECVEMLAFAKEKGMKKVHALGISNITSTAVFSYMADYFDVITYDSRKWKSGTMYGMYWNPYTHKYGAEMMRTKGIGGQAKVCMCPYCENMPEGLSETKKMEWVDGHNLYWMVNEVNMQYNLLKLDEKMWHKDVVAPVDTRGKAAEALIYADKLLKNGIENTIESEGGITHGYW